MKYIMLLQILFVISLAQSSVMPLKYACECADLLNQSDCQAKDGCQWITILNSTSQQGTQSSIKLQGICRKDATQSIIQIPTFCSDIVTISQCSSTIGCALVDSKCTIFAGCSAYIKTTNTACQAISTQCTTNGVRCTIPTACSTYINQEFCTKNISSSGAKSCNWNTISSICEDKKCDDAPRTYNTQEKCNSWIAGCQTKGIGCTMILLSCSEYQQSKGCIGMIGLEGPCMANRGQNNCRQLLCTDAPSTYSTNDNCDKFLKGCITNGRGCMSFLQSCDSYLKTSGCTGLIGIDGPCISNQNKGSFSCRALTCEDAPSSTNTNESCSRFLKGCITTGQGCASQLGTCSSYKGTNTTCFLYVGLDGKCRGISEKIENCVARSCYDAPTSMISNAECNAFQIGCVTTGFGCTPVLQQCSLYSGTNTTCSRYIGVDGKCTAPISQTSATACRAKMCSAAPATFKTNSECQNYSYICVTNGAGCIQPQVCESTELAISCEGQTLCSYNQICLNRSSCFNYYTKSLCLLNMQLYKPVQPYGATYSRKCLWENNTCQNSLCIDVPLYLTTDQACDSALSGCLTNGAGCVDISVSCTQYNGLTSQCLRFKGLFGSQQCSQLISVTDPSTPCVVIENCSQAKAFTFNTLTSDLSCQQFLKGCYFDGKDNCTNQNCDTYYGTFNYCSSLNITDVLNQTFQCWKTYNLNDPTTPCENKTQSQTCAQPTGNQYLTNEQCEAYLKGCVWNGNQFGGCMAPHYACSSYTGTLSTCSRYKEFSNRQCTKKQGFCRQAECYTKMPPPEAITSIQKGIYCQQYIDNSDSNCQMNFGVTCQSSLPTSCNQFVAVGSDNPGKADYCQGLNYPGVDRCGYVGGDYCSVASCEQFTPQDSEVNRKAKYCQSLTIDGMYFCGLASVNAKQCSQRTCYDYGITQITCNSSYQINCAWNQLSNECYMKENDCNLYIIPTTYIQTILLKTNYCGSLGCSFSSVSSITCSFNYDCTGIIIPDAMQTNQDKATFCISQRVSDGQTQCAYSADLPDRCSQIGACNTYAAYGFPMQGDLENQLSLTHQIFCQTLFDSAGKVCGFFIGTRFCTVPLYTCATYETYGNTIEENQALCSQLTQIINNSKCTSNTAGKSQCKDPACEDVTTGQSFVTCSQYNSSCTFDGLACIKIEPACTSYVAQTIGSGPKVNCADLIQLDGFKCGWTSGNNCTIRVCEQLKGTDANNITCAAYLIGCQYNGQQCVDKGNSCTQYIPFGLQATQRATICNAMQNNLGQKCTYIIGQNSCIDTQACFYNLPDQITNEDAFTLCSLLQDYNGIQCGYQIGTSFCSPKQCNQAPYAQSDAECSNYMKGCELDTTSQCSSIFCASAPATITTNQACGEYRNGCLTNGAGCIESTAPCAAYKGTQTSCNRFVGNGLPCTNIQNASPNDVCINRSCSLNTTAKSNADCDVWFPPSNGIHNCVWGGSLGCVPPQLCQFFKGTVDSCPTYIANDGPCFGKGSDASPSPCISNNSVCSAAPKHYQTDQQCKSWGQSCMTNGFGCMQIYPNSCSMIQSPQACLLYKQTIGLNCDLAQQCKTRPSFCGLSVTAFECNNTPLIGSETIQCGWDAVTQQCVKLNCDLLPVSLTSDSACNLIFPNCTTNGAGCVTKGACSTYNKQACGVAATTDIQKKCIWQNSSCRPIECTDNTTATTDSECNSFLAGCRSTGLGCLSKITCSVLIKPQLCLQDSDGYPCLWWHQSSSGGICMTYLKCSDIISSNHSECQAASKLCTTNGITCVAITSCHLTPLKASCIIGTDGQCGWMPVTGSISSASCQLFTNCSAAIGSTQEQCKQWGSNCITDGRVCVEKSNCASYQTQIACDIGIDGICYWDSIKGSCRTQVCSDATTNINTHQGCVSFKASTACTTTGSSCIAQSLCSLYKSEIGCFQGTDGVCLWETEKQVCRLKQCQDNLFTKSSACRSDIPSLLCVSNGVNCIPQSTCPSYTAREACLGGGSDGACAFTPGTNTTTPNIGTCAQFSQCSNADQDQLTCNSRSDVCYYNSTVINGTTITKCQPHTCSTKAIGSSCQPVPSWDLSSYQICVLVGSTCTEGNPNQLTSQTCYNRSLGIGIRINQSARRAQYKA